MVYTSPMCAAPKIIGFYEETIIGGDHILNIIPFELVPTVYSPFDGVFSKSSTGDWRIVSGDIYMQVDDSTVCSLVKDFKEGDTISKSEPFVFYNSIGQGFRPMRFSFWNVNGNPEPHYKYSGYPKFAVAESEYFISLDNIYDSKPSFAPDGTVQVVWSYGDSEVNQAGIEVAVVKQEITYVEKGQPAVVPSLTTQYPPTGWISSETLEIYNGEPINRKVIMTAIYDTYTDFSVTVEYKYFDSIKEDYTKKSIVLNPFYKQPILSRFYYTLVPQCEYYDIEFMSFYNAAENVSRPVNVSRSMGATMYSYNTSYSLSVFPVFYPVLNDGSFKSLEIDLYFYSDLMSGVKEWEYKYYIPGENTEPPYKIKNGYYVDWLPLNITPSSFTSPVIDVEHLAETNRGFVYIGTRGQIAPSNKGSIIPILMFLSQNSSRKTNIYNFGKYIKKH